MYAIASGSIFWGVRHSLSSRADMGNFFANVEAPRAVVEPPRISFASLLAIETVIGSMGDYNVWLGHELRNVREQGTGLSRPVRRLRGLCPSLRSLNRELGRSVSGFPEFAPGRET